MTKIRKAFKEDADYISLLVTELGYPNTSETLYKRINEYIANPNYGIAVCEVDSKVVGFIAWSISNLFVLDKVRFHIEGIAVNKEYRFQGIGKKLIEFLEDIARQNNPSIIDLTTGVRREIEGTHKFYKNLAYNNEGHMSKLYLRKEL